MSLTHSWLGRSGMSSFARIQRQVVVGVCRLGTALLLAHFQVMALDDVIEAVIPHAVLFAELALVHLPQFATTDAVILLAHSLDKLHDESLFG